MSKIKLCKSKVDAWYKDARNRKLTVLLSTTIRSGNIDKAADLCDENFSFVRNQKHTAKNEKRLRLVNLLVERHGWEYVISEKKTLLGAVHPSVPKAENLVCRFFVDIEKNCHKKFFEMASNLAENVEVFNEKRTSSKKELLEIVDFRARTSKPSIFDKERTKDLQQCVFNMVKVNCFHSVSRTP